jgi:hypothetical protein
MDTQPQDQADQSQDAPQETVATGLVDEPLSATKEEAEKYIEAPALTAAAQAEVKRLADLEEAKRTFTQRVLDARKPETPTIVKAPVAPRILEQTARELAAGAATSKKHAEHLTKHGKPRGTHANDGHMTPVFRPADYVPDIRKGQGNTTGARNLPSA